MANDIARALERMPSIWFTLSPRERPALSACSVLEQLERPAIL
jgi:hypothetical protein